MGKKLNAPSKSMHPDRGFAEFIQVNLFVYMWIPVFA